MDSSSLLWRALYLASQLDVVEHEPLDLEEELAPHILPHAVVFLHVVGGIRGHYKRIP